MADYTLELGDKTPPPFFLNLIPHLVFCHSKKTSLQLTNVPASLAMELQGRSPRTSKLFTVGTSLPCSMQLSSSLRSRLNWLLSIRNNTSVERVEVWYVKHWGSPAQLLIGSKFKWWQSEMATLSSVKGLEVMLILFSAASHQLSWCPQAELGQL